MTRFVGAIGAVTVVIIEVSYVDDISLIVAREDSTLDNVLP